MSLDSFNCRREITVGDQKYTYFSIPEAEKNGLEGASRLPFSLKVLLENLLRHEDGARSPRMISPPSPPGSKTRARPDARSPIARPRADAGLHRRSGRGRSRRNA